MIDVTINLSLEPGLKAPDGRVLNGETTLRVTAEQLPRFYKADKAGEPIPEDIRVSFMQQLFGDDPQTS